MLEQCPPGKRREERPRNSWLQEVTTGMIEQGINNVEQIDKDEWNNKINIQTQKDAKTLIFCK